MSAASLPPLLTIVGPTAVGKTDLALALGERFDVEAISADSRQIYRGMDIGTAKASLSERERLPHHLLDVVDPDEVLTLAQYQEAAFAAIDDVLARGRLPLLVGGTGLYVWAVIENWQIPRVAPRPDIRRRLEEEAVRTGAQAMHARLAEADAAAAAKIHPANVRRVIRALEVLTVSGEPISTLQRKGPPRWRQLILGLSAPRERLYDRADRRVEAMIERGLVGEVQTLLARGYGPALPAMSGLGYKQIGEHLAGRCSLDEAIRRVKTGTHRFIRQQRTWFRECDPRIRWFGHPPPVEEIECLVRDWLAVAT